jgi:hypothetical protein
VRFAMEIPLMSARDCAVQQKGRSATGPGVVVGSAG